VEGDGAAFDSDLARAWRKYTGQNLDENGFACAIVTDKGHDLALSKGKVDALQSADAAKLLGDARKADQRDNSHSSPLLHKIWLATD
jgi:hypothetical protein